MRARDPATIVFAIAIAIFILAKLALITAPVIWDEAVFLSMGRFIATGGAQGFWETLRPPMLPILLAPFHLLRFPVIGGRLLMAAAAVAGPVFLFLLLRRRTTATAAAGAGILLLFSELWFSYSTYTLTDVMSSTLIIIAAYLFDRDEHFWAGAVAAAAFLTRFPAGIIIACMAAAALLQRKHTALLPVAAGFLVPVLCWLAVNAAVWGNPLLPMTSGFHNVYTETRGAYYNIPGFYLFYLLKRLPLAILALVGAWAWRTRLPPLAIMGIVSLVFFEWLPHDEFRYAILIMPGIIFLAMLGLERVRPWLERNVTTHSIAIILVLSAVPLLIADAKLIAAPMPQQAAYQEYFSDHDVNGTLLTTDPVVGWYAKARVVPAYIDIHAFDDTSGIAAAAVAPQDIPCVSASCEERERIMARLRSEFRTVSQDNERNYTLFQR